MTVLLILSSILFLTYSSLILYYRSAWRSIPQFKPVQGSRHRVPITVIVPARNEESSLAKLLHGLTNQSYDRDFYELIVVDDHSTDRTAEIVKQFASSNVKLVELKDHIPADGINSYKKKAIEIAIAQSMGELIVTTDADCTVQETWLQTIASFYKEHKPEFIVMPVSYDCRNNFLEIFQALDFMSLQGITAASVQSNMHSMCNGANLAYTRKAFDAVNGFNGINNIASGDDMLLMHKIYQQFPSGIKYLHSENVIVQTEAMHSWNDFLNQRIRWASKADKYDDKRIFWVLLLVYLFNVWLLVLPVMALLRNFQYSIFNIQFSLWTVWVKLLLLKTVVELIFLWPVAKFFHKEKLLWYFPVAQPVHILYTVIAGWLGKFGSYQWKERKVV